MYQFKEMDAQIFFVSFAFFQIGEIVANVLNNTFSNTSSKLRIEKFHAVGFSLGAQLLGAAARKLIEYSNGSYILPRY